MFSRMLQFKEEWTAVLKENKCFLSFRTRILKYYIQFLVSQYLKAVLIKATCDIQHSTEEQTKHESNQMCFLTYTQFVWITAKNKHQR